MASFANTLRLRLALRVSNVNPALAKEQGEKALTDPAGLMQGQEDNMKLIPKRQFVTGGNENIFRLDVRLGCQCSFALRKWSGHTRTRR